MFRLLVGLFGFISVIMFVIVAISAVYVMMALSGWCVSGVMCL